MMTGAVSTTVPASILRVAKHPTPCTRELFSHESALPFKSDFKTMEMAGAGGRENFHQQRREWCVCSAVSYLPFGVSRVNCKEPTR